MKISHLLFATLAALWGAGCAPITAVAKDRSVTLDGIRWETTMADAIRRAQSEKKPILLLQLFGRLDDAFC